jgi:hypothetical protein
MLLVNKPTVSPSVYVLYKTKILSFVINRLDMYFRIEVVK